MDFQQKYALRRQLIAERAQHAALISHFQRTGQEVPQSIVANMQQIENEAAAHFHPSELQGMLRESQQAQMGMEAGLDRAYESKNNQAVANEILDRTQELTCNMAGAKNGLLPSEVAKLAKGEKLVFENHEKARWDEKKIAKALGRTPQSLREEEKNLDWLVDVRRMRSEEEYQQALKKTGITDEDVKTWANGGGVAVGLHKRRAEYHKEEPDEIEYEPSDRDSLRAEIIRSCAEKEPQTFERERISDDYLNHTETDSKGEEVPSRTAHIAAAFEKHGL